MCVPHCQQRIKGGWSAGAEWNVPSQWQSEAIASMYGTNQVHLMPLGQHKDKSGFCIG